MITFGNSQYGYREYKARVTSDRPRKADRPMVNARRISPHFLRSRVHDRSFHVSLTFPELQEPSPNGPPLVRDRLLVRVDVPGKDRTILLKQQFEIIFFVDTIYFAEEERGYIPFNFPWDLKQLPAGEHILTVNIVTFNNQFGVGSRKIKVIK